MASSLLPKRATAALFSAPSQISSNFALRAFATKKPMQKQVRIEEKLGVGLRYRKPRTWDGTRKMQKHYETSEIKNWRELYNMPKMQHSLSKVSYSDEEIMEWRTMFDKYAGATDMIGFASFQDLIKNKYEGRLEAKELPSKVMEVWQQFDEDKNNFIDFGEFCKASFKFDFLRLKDDLTTLGSEKTIEKYKDEDGYITEEGIFDMMKDSDFTLSTTSDMRKILKMMDKDKDGMVGDQDMKKFLESSEMA